MTRVPTRRAAILDCFKNQYSMLPRLGEGLYCSTMAKQILVTAPRKVEVRDIPDDPLEPGMARVEAHYFGISIGTEMNTYRGGVNWHTGRDPETRLFYPDADKRQWEYPATVGYSPVGRVTEVASDVTNVKIGDMVCSWYPHITPARYYAARLWPVPKGLDPRACTFLQLVRTAANVVHHASPRLGDTVAIFGLGVVGLLTLQLAKLAGAHRIIAFDLIPKRREMGLKMGANEALDPTTVDPGNAVRDLNEKRGADVAIECAASAVALQQATRAVGPLGRVVMASMPNNPAPFHFGQEVHFNGIGIRGANVSQMPSEMGPLWNADRRDALCREWLGKLDLLPLITHEFEFEKAAEAYALLDTNPRDVISAIFRCPAAGKV